ncbi:MAG: DUF5752 family protein [Nanobdellota archaeon]
MLDESKKKLANVDASKSFKTKGGDEARSLHELYDGLCKVNLEIFGHHANKDKNDYATWVENSVGDKTLAEELRKTTDLEETKKIVKKRIDELEKRVHMGEVINKINSFNFQKQKEMSNMDNKIIEKKEPNDDNNNQDISFGENTTNTNASQAPMPNAPNMSELKNEQENKVNQIQEAKEELPEENDQKDYTSDSVKDDDNVSIDFPTDKETGRLSTPPMPAAAEINKEANPGKTEQDNSLKDNNNESFLPDFGKTEDLSKEAKPPMPVGMQSKEDLNKTDNNDNNNNNNNTITNNPIPDNTKIGQENSDNKNQQPIIKDQINNKNENTQNMAGLMPSNPIAAQENNSSNNNKTEEIIENQQTGQSNQYQKAQDMAGLMPSNPVNTQENSNNNTESVTEKQASNQAGSNQYPSPLPSNPIGAQENQKAEEIPNNNQEISEKQSESNQKPSFMNNTSGSVAENDEIDKNKEGNLNNNQNDLSQNEDNNELSVESKSGTNSPASGAVMPSQGASEMIKNMKSVTTHDDLSKEFLSFSDRLKDFTKKLWPFRK